MTVTGADVDAAVAFLDGAPEPSGGGEQAAAEEAAEAPQEPAEAASDPDEAPAENASDEPAQEAQEAASDEAEEAEDDGEQEAEEPEDDGEEEQEAEEAEATPAQKKRQSTHQRNKARIARLEQERDEARTRFDTAEKQRMEREEGWAELVHAEQQANKSLLARLDSLEKALQNAGAEMPAVNDELETLRRKDADNTFRMTQQQKREAAEQQRALQQDAAEIIGEARALGSLHDVDPGDILSLALAPSWKGKQLADVAEAVAKAQGKGQAKTAQVQAAAKQLEANRSAPKPIRGGQPARKRYNLGEVDDVVSWLDERRAGNAP